MDNISENNNSAEPNGNDIKLETENIGGNISLDDVFNIDLLSSKIQETVNGKQNIQVEEEIQDPSEMFLQETKTEPIVLPDVQVETNVKKYVIHVDPENVNYMEHLTINERRQVINKILKEQSFLTEEEIKANKQKKKIAHLLLAIFTFTIAFPLFFIMINSAAQMTIQSYQTSKANFSKLYREQGKIKRK